MRDAFLGLGRFEQFQESLGIARNVLTERLNRLVEEGILDRIRYSERPERFEYRLTQKGRDLQIALTLRCSGATRSERKAATDHSPQVGQEAGRCRVRAQGGGEVLRADEIEIVDGPGLKVG